MENAKQYTYEFISPKSLAEEMAVNLVKTGLKTKHEFDKIKEVVHTVQAVPNKIYSNVRMSIQKKIDTISSELKHFKSNVSQKIDDIDKGKYEINRTVISINISKPARPKAEEVVADAGMEQVATKKMTQVLHENMTEIKQNSKDVFHAIGRLQSAVGKLLKNMSPIKYRESSPVAANDSR